MYENASTRIESLLMYSKYMLSGRDSDCVTMLPSGTSLAWPSRQSIVAVSLVYITIVQLLRFRRKKQIEAYVTENSPLTPETAQQVVHKISTLEFPMLHKASLQFALFRTYGIPTISDLLQNTTLFSSPTTAARRYADTAALISEFLGRTYGTRDWVCVSCLIHRCPDSSADSL